MAQAKTKSDSKARGSGRSGSKSNGAGRSRAKPKAKAKAKPKAKAKAGASGKPSPNGAGSPSGVADSIKHGAEEVGSFASKAKVPLIASGAALAGVAGAVVASRTNRRTKVMGVSMPKHLPRPKLNGMKADAKTLSGAVVDAAERADRLGRGLSRVASSVRDVGETANKAAKKT